MRTFIVFAPAIVGAAIACRDPSPPPPPASEAPTETAPAEEKTGPIATVEGVPVSRARFERELAQSRARYAKARKEVQPALLDNLRRSLVRRLVESEVLRQKANEWEIAPSDEELDAMWTRHRERFGTDDAFRAFLERAGTTEADLKNQFVDNLILDRIKQRLDERLEIPEETLQEYYRSRPQRFERPEEVRVAQILIEVPPGVTEEEAADRRALAQTTLERLRDGADFARVATEVSEGPARMRGGDLGFLPRGRLVPEVDRVAFELKPGQLSDVIQSRFGFHIVRVMEHRPERKLSFEEARPQIVERLRGQMLRSELHEHLEQWKRQMDIELFESTDLYTERASQREMASPRKLTEEGVRRLSPPGVEGGKRIDLEDLPSFRPAEEPAQDTQD